MIHADEIQEGTARIRFPIATIKRRKSASTRRSSLPNGQTREDLANSIFGVLKCWSDS